MLLLFLDKLEVFKNAELWHINFYTKYIIIPTYTQFEIICLFTCVNGYRRYLWICHVCSFSYVYLGYTYTFFASPHHALGDKNRKSKVVMESLG